MTLAGNKNKAQAFIDTLQLIKDQPYSKAYALPGEFYTDPFWLLEEQALLFGKDWVCVGREEEVKNRGDYFTFQLVNEPLVIVHGEDGKIRALSNVCRHRGTVIMTDQGNTKNLLCPYHHWQYSTTGKLINAPSMTSDARINLENCSLPSVPIEIWKGFLFVCLAQKPSDLRSQLQALDRKIHAYHLEEMHLHYLENEIWRINWKSLVENFMEGYHLSPLHRKTLHKVNPSRLCRHLPPGELHFGYEVGFTSRVSNDTPAHKELTEEQRNHCIMFSIPPGLTVGIGSDYSSFLCIRPLSVEAVAVKKGLIFHGEEWQQADMDKAVELFQQTMEEDKEVLIRVQQGMHSKRYQPGPLAPKDMEGTIWDFYQYMARSIC